MLRVCGKGFERSFSPIVSYKGKIHVTDGNMKNARQVCSCRDAGELKFAGMDGSVVIGK